MHKDLLFLTGFLTSRYATAFYLVTMPQIRFLCDCRHYNFLIIIMIIKLTFWHVMFCMRTENVSLSSRAALCCIRISPFVVERSSTDSNDCAPEHVSRNFVLQTRDELLSKPIIYLWRLDE